MTRLNPEVLRLAEQAKGFVDLNQHVGANSGCMIYTYEGLNKFAELIVRECIKLSKPQVEYPLDGTWIEKSYWEGCYDSSKRIEEHFGVK